LFAAPVYKSYGPAMARGQSPGAPSGLALPLKDIGLALNEAHATELPLPLAKLLDNRLGAARDKGFTDDDWSIALAREARQPEMAMTLLPRHCARTAQAAGRHNARRPR